MGSRRQAEGLSLDSNRNNSSGVMRRKAEWLNVYTGLWLDMVAEPCGICLICFYFLGEISSKMVN